ncbi:uncharacterized protein LOC127700926 isoform X1 [Mytilus californianus]|uniref:uncharacterized protein LOC127700926 isoform X1 n=1 Tax=Mytilus californianus TaxID=6549 RepID=UPI0022468CF9|nr:uncharacterized protein LOC127700926 isoform X1 [Mytilus californianus]XP_052060616.1 uncharacterized protein LOC127700926 isoform X1 [Mytilus californianus]
MKTLFMTWFIKVIVVTMGYRLRCPVAGEWRLRAKIFDCGRDYVCLLRSPENSYHENCDGLDYSSTGSKLIFEPNFNKAQCSSKRYQPFPFSTDGNSKCMYQKSFCNEEGQIVYHEGTVINDTTCGCDFSKGYRFVIKPRHNCYCIPSEEDCACHKLLCKNEEYICPHYSAAILNISCPEITTELSSKSNMSSLFGNRFNDAKNFDNIGRKHRLPCIFLTTALLIIMIIVVPLYACEVKHVHSKIQNPESLEAYIDLPEASSSTTDSETFSRKQQPSIIDILIFRNVLTKDQGKQIKEIPSSEAKNRNRMLMDILLRGHETMYNLFIDILEKDGKYEKLANTIKGTEITDEDKSNVHNCNNVHAKIVV